MIKKKPPLLTDPAEMCRCAEVRLDDGQKRMIPGANAAGNLLHELQACQIELEILHESLRQTRMEADTALAHYTKFYESAPVGYFTFERDGSILEANPASAALLGIESSKLCGRRMNFFIQCKERPVFNAFLVRVFTGTGKETCDLALKCADAVPRLVRIEASADEARQTCSAVMTDITRFHAIQRQLEEQLRQIENVTRELNSVFDSVSDPMFLHDQDYRITRANRAYADRAGMSFKEMLGKPYYEVFPRLDGPLTSSSEPFNQEEPAAERKEIRIDNGEIFDSRTFAVRDRNDSHLYTLHIMENTTRRKQAEQAMQHAIRAFKTLSAGNHELAHATDETQLLQAMCRVLVETGGYRAAWVGYALHNAEKIIRPMAQCGFENGYMEALKITWADDGFDHEPASNAISSDKTQIVQDIAATAANTPWKERALQSGFASAIALPLHVDDEAPGCLTIISAEKDAFNQGEIALLEEMADDLAFGIRMLRLRQEQQRGASQLRKVLEGTVQAIAAMVEMRDPYTAGHQRRVAQLASMIATEMGLSEEQVRGIHLAGTIHDLGKIQTPAEILSKPGKLSHGEFIVIKDHAQNSYNILKDIVFPWPIAQMAWQHHEKLDGSGYPLGLKGNEILLEARILTVADVVEAMSSHRPYRPGLGIDAALEEISRGRGVKYDPDAADICTSLFREKGFRFE